MFFSKKRLSFIIALATLVFPFQAQTKTYNTPSCNVSGVGIRETSVSIGKGMISCNEGYAGIANYTCAYDGEKVTATGCTAITCNVTGSGVNPATVPYNTSSTHKPCNSGYAGTAEIPACTTNDANLTATGCAEITFTPRVTEPVPQSILAQAPAGSNACVPSQPIVVVTCKVPLAPINGKVIPKTGSVVGVNKTAALTCGKGYAASGDFSITCNPDGNWSGPLGTCITSGGLPDGGNNPPIISNGYRIHTFTSNGTFTVFDNRTVEYLIVAGGGGSGPGLNGGGGGGGGVLKGFTTLSYITPNYPILVGAGGAQAGTAKTYDQNDRNGGNSSFNSLVAIGGGGGATALVSAPSCIAGNGGSGGGGCHSTAFGGAATSGQGYPGGGGYDSGITASGGGGGAGGAGGNGNSTAGGSAGRGIQSSITGSVVWYAVGGPGINSNTSKGGTAASGGSSVNQSGAANTGNGAGAATTSNGTKGGSGVVVIRYPYTP